MMKIYTKTGDDGTTGLFGGGRIPKNHPRTAAYGTVDELNAWLGVVRAGGLATETDATLERIQSELFALGADLATPDGVKAAFRVRRTLSSDAEWMEEAIDRMTESIPPLETFILPGGTLAAAQIHVARAVCRRAEREVVTLSCIDRKSVV